MAVIDCLEDRDETLKRKTVRAVLLSYRDPFLPLVLVGTVYQI